jgi:hypothetical protein
MVADMETHGSISAAEASAALASVQQSRTRVAWAGYPQWYWLTTAAGLAALSFATRGPVWLGLAGVAVVTVLLLMVVVAASKARGVCEYPTRSAMRWWEVTVLYGPATAVLLAGAAASRSAWWTTTATAVLVFVLFAGTGLTLSARAARR